MVTPAAPVNPVALAEIVTVAEPSVSALSGAVSVKVADVEPAGIETVAGTVSREAVSDASDTVSAVVSVPEMDTVPVPVPPSTMLAGSVTARLVFSLSSTPMVALPSVQFATWAVMVALCVPLIFASSTTVIVNAAEVCPAGIVTLAGTWIAVVSLDVSATVTALAGAALTVTVPAAVPAPSLTVAGALTPSVAVSLSFTVNVALPLA